MLKRREFLTISAAGATALLAPPGLLAATDQTDLSPKDKLRSLVHQGFRCLDRDGGAIRLELVEFRDGPQAEGLEQFSLVFEAADGKLPTGLYEVYHPRTGLSLYHLTPSDSVAGRYTTYMGLLT